MESERSSIHRSTALSLRAKVSPVSVPVGGYPAATSVPVVIALCTEGDRATARSPARMLMPDHLPGS